MSENKTEFDPAMFNSLDELRAAFPEEAENFVETEDGKGFTRRGEMGKTDWDIDLALKESNARRQYGDFLQLCDRLVNSDLPQSEKEKVVDLVSGLKKHCGPNLERFYDDEHLKYDPNEDIGIWLSKLPMPEDEYKRLCEVSESELKRIMDKVVDLGTEPDLMSHGTFIDGLKDVESFHGIIARNPRFAKRWERMSEYKNAVRKNSGNCAQGPQSISTFDPHSEIELLQNITERKNHKIYALFIHRDLIKSFPEYSSGYKNISIDEDSEIYTQLQKFISNKFGCGVKIDSIYHTNGYKLVVHGEFEFTPEQAKKLIVANRNKESGMTYSRPVDETDIDNFLAEDLARISKPAEITASLVNKIWGFSGGCCKVTLLIKPTRSDIESGRIVRNQGALLSTTDSESDWESRIPLNRIRGIVFGKNMNLAKVVSFARNLQIPIYDSDGNVIWPVSVGHQEISEGTSSLQK